MAATWNSLDKGSRPRGNGLCKRIKHLTFSINVGCWNHLPYGLFKIFQCLMHTSLIIFNIISIRLPYHHTNPAKSGRNYQNRKE